MTKAQEAEAALAVRRRLLALVQRHYGTQQAFLAKWPDVGPSTWKEWTRLTKPRLPSTRFLLGLVLRHGVSLDWLLTGKLKRLTTGAAEVRRLQREVLELQFENDRLKRARKKPTRTRGRSHRQHSKRRER